MAFGYTERKFGPVVSLRIPSVRATRAAMLAHAVEAMEPRQLLCADHLVAGSLPTVSLGGSTLAAALPTATSLAAKATPSVSFVARAAASTPILSDAPAPASDAGAANELAVQSTTPSNGAQSVSTATSVTVQFTIAVNPATISTSTFELRDASNALVPATVSYNATTLTATLTPAAALPVTIGYFTARVRGGSTGVSDTIGNSLSADFSWSFTTGVTTFTESTVFSNLQSPTAVRFTPDGRVFVAQKSGIIVEFDNLTDTTPTTVADLRTQVHNFWDRGLLGMAIDPNFATSQYIYVLYTYDADLGGTAPKWGQPGGTTDGAGPSPTTTGATASGRLSRLTIGAGNVMVPGSEKVLVEDWQQQFYTHSVGTVAFGPDGSLYASAGEGASPEFADYGQVANGFGDPVNEGGSLRSQDLRTPNDPTSLDGSVIRVDPATGAALPTNPNYLTGNDENARRIVSYGFRNPYRFTFRPGTSEIWLGDVGWNEAEEINRLTSPTTTVQNFGWPAYEGNNRQPGYEATNVPLLNALYAQGNSAVTFPYFTYSHTQQVVAGSNEPIGGSSVSGLAFYTGGSYPTAYKNALFFTDYARQRIWVMNTGPNGLPDPATRKVFATVSGPVDLQIGPNGDIFYVDFNNGTVRRFQYFSGNRPPTAVLSTNKSQGPTPLTVQFSASQSTDPDTGDTLTYAWDLDGDGQFDDSTAASPTYTYLAAGNVTARVRVTDAAGLSDTASTLVSAGNTSPTPTILSPSISLKWSVGSLVTFSGSATDAEDGILPASQLSWTLILHHDNLINPSNSHIHPIQSYQGVAGGTFVAPDHGYPSRLELFLTATDSGGLTSTTSIVLSPQTVQLNFTSSPAGIQLAVNGDASVTPFTTTVIAGSSSSVSAPAQQLINGVPYQFGFWSDGGAASHNILAGNSDGTVSTTYTIVGGPDVTSGLVHRWKLEEGSGIATADDIGTAAGTLTNGPTWTTGRVGASAVNFDGVNDYVATTENLATTLGAGTSTLTAWIKTTQVGDDLFWQAPGITGIEQAGSDRDMFWGWLDASGRIGIQAGDGAAAKSTNAVNDGQWHFVALSRDAIGGQLQVWVDGVFNAAAGGWQSNRDTPFYGFGRIDDSSGTPAYFKGALDDLRVYNRVLTNAEVSSVFTASIPNTPPSFVNPPATPITVSGKTLSLSTLGADDLSEASLTYTWSVVGTPPALVTFSANGTNAAKSSLATFARSGAYTLRVTITDLGGLTASSELSVTVRGIATSLTVTPGVAPGLTVGQQQQFSALVKDQFGDALSPQPSVTWVLSAGGGTLSPSGLYTAGGLPGTSYTVTATSGEPQGTASGTIVNSAPTVAIASTASPNPATGTTANLSVTGADDAGATNLTYTWSVVGTPPASVAFSLNGSTAAANTVATFSKSGSYTLRATITDAAGLSVTSDVVAVVQSTLATLAITPSVATVAAGSTQAFTASGVDQFGLALAAPIIWSVDAGGAGSIDSATGQFIAGSIAGVATVRATSGSVTSTVAVTVTGSVVVPTGLIDRWNFEEGPSITAVDLVGANPGTPTNGPVRTTGVVGASAIALDGIDDYVAIPNDLAPAIGVGATTIAAWIKTTQVGNDTVWLAPGLTGVEQAGGNEDIFWGWIDASGRIGAQAGDGPVAKSTNPINDGKWHHVAFSRDSVTGLLQTWVDGVLNSTAGGYQGPRLTPIRSFGRIDDTGGTPAYFQGAIDDLRIYNRVLASIEVATLAANNTFTTPGDYILKPDPTGTATQVLLGGVQVALVPAALVTSFNFAPVSAGADSLTIDLSAGNPIPAGGVSFDGGTGLNTLSVIGSAGADTFGLNASTLVVNGKTVTFSAGTTSVNVLGQAGNDTMSINATTAAAVQFDGGLTVSDQDQLTINAGTYKLAADPSATSAHLTVVNNGTFDLNGIAATIAALTGAGTVTNSSVTAATLSVAGGSTLPGVSNGAGTFTGVISNGTGGVSLAKTGTGIFTLTGISTYIGGTSVTGGTLDSSTGSILASTGPMSITNAGSLLIARQIAPASLTVGVGATLKLTQIDTTINVAGRSTAGSLNNTGLIDVGSTALIVGPAGGSGGGLTEGLILSQIHSARGTGNWTGSTGLTSSTAVVNPSRRAVGFTLVNGQWTIAGTVLGDSNLDGVTNIDDLSKLAQNYNLSVKSWQTGDFNFDGAVNIDDLSLLAQNYNTTIDSADSPAADAPSLALSRSIIASVVSQPDLQSSVTNLPAKAKAGNNLAVATKLKNQGSDAGRNVIRLYLSKDKKLSPGADALVGKETFAGVKAGQTIRRVMTISVPKGLASGKYYLIAKIDTGNTSVKSIQVL